MSTTSPYISMTNAKTIMVWGDTHIPYTHKDAYKFLKAVKLKYRPNEVICTGDELDKHSLSFHDSDPDLLSAGDELNLSIDMLKRYYKLFPKLTVLESNHGSMVFRKAKHHGIPLKYIKSYADILEAPKGWVWKKSHITPMGNGQQLYVVHGLEKNSGRMARNMGMCVVEGHYHSDFSVTYSSTPENLIWGVSAGCLIDKESLAFAYDKANLKRPILGCTIIKNGVPILIPMTLNTDGDWNGCC